VSATDQLSELVDAGGVCILSGAGISTESGIPDYRGPGGQLRARLPMTIAEFTGSAAARRRYWARSHVGWQRMARAQPNAGHRAVAALQRTGALTGIITQNVDGLHQAAGARDVIDLHGNLDRVVCLRCDGRSSRAALHERLRAVNGEPEPGALAASKPDGDVELEQPRIAQFTPDVVFFGENVPRSRVDDCYALLARSSSLLVLGSSLAVMSGLRFVHRARRDGIPVAIVNQGVTRGDPLADLKLEAGLGETLSALAG
jgi:NAD-dependent SIR2 family protein deacetylase